MPTALEHALDYVKRGYYVFPIAHGTKVPFADFPWQDLSTNKAAILLKAAETPKYKGCNWALDCAKSGIFVLDVDVKPATEKRGPINGYETLKTLPPAESPIVVKSPGGGEHRYFSGVGFSNSASKIGEGLDVRCDGGYVLLPGSQAKGGVYTLIKDAGAPPPVPTWVIEKIGQPKDPALVEHKAKECVVAQPDQAWHLLEAIGIIQSTPDPTPNMNRNDTLYLLSNKVKDAGVTRETAKRLIDALFGDKVYAPDFTQNELNRTIDSAYDGGQNPIGSATAEALFPSQEKDAYRCATDIVRANIKPRQWLLYGRYAKSFVTVTASPGGVGKSSLALLECFALSTGIQYTYHQVRETGASWYYNTEDDYDELERRIEAIKIHHNVKNTDFKHRFFFSSGRTKPLKLVADDKKLGLVINETGIKWLIDTITEQQTKLFILDPFVRAHSVSEQGIDLDVVVQQLQRVADATGCAISILHHTTKGKSNGYGDADKVRGSGSLVASARIVHMLAPMEEKDARQYGLNACDNSWYCRMDIAKGNLTAPSHDIMWFKKVSVQVIDGDKDTIGAIERATLSRVVPTDPVEMIKDLVSKSMNSGEEKSFYTLAVAIAAMELTGLKRNSLEVRLKDIYASPVYYGGRDFRPTMVRGGRGKETAGLRCDEAP